MDLMEIVLEGVDWIHLPRVKHGRRAFIKKNNKPLGI
jgi:hypothetical protein